MDKRDLRDPVMADFAKHHHILAERLVRNDRTGCLEYHGPPGRYSGNPVLHHGKKSIHLRRHIWRIHKRRIPKGLEVRMICSNGFCHNPKHMKLGRKAAAYISSPREYINRIDHRILRAILFFREKASSKAIGKVFGYSEYQIRGIWKSKKLSKLIPPPNWRPSLSIERQVEDAIALSSRNFYLSHATLKLALVEINNTKLSPTYRQVVSKILKGDTTKSLGPKLHRSKTAIMYIYRRGLVELYKELGNRRWINLVSLGRITLWCKIPYTWKLNE